MKKVLIIVLLIIVAIPVFLFLYVFIDMLIDLQYYAEYTDASHQEVMFNGASFRLMDIEAIDENLSKMIDYGECIFFHEDSDSIDKYHIKDKGVSIRFAAQKEWGDGIDVYDDHKVISAKNGDESISYYVRDDVYGEYEIALSDYAKAVKNADFGKYYFYSFPKVIIPGENDSAEETATR